VERGFAMSVVLKNGHSNFFDLGFDVFGHQVSVMFCDDVKHTLSELHPDSKTDDAEAIIYMYDNEAKAEIFLRFEANVGSIVHESSHAVWNLFTYHGVKLDDEAFAYHLGYLVKEILRAQTEAQEGKAEYARLKELENIGIFCCLL
jgi:hypothetical protein